ncbi:MAG: DNA polymerase III subunit beta [Lachnospiraceae bacterium]|nr:DNA polymerase III subunit beta [Lachnospiraceae bacterium]
MKIICSKSSLFNGVQIVSKAIPSKTTMTILQCILINASEDQIKLTANDTELGIETTVEGTIAEKGIIALDAKFFQDIVRNLPDSDITIETDSNYMTTITCENSKFNIIGKAGDDFSYLPVIEKQNTILMSQFTLKEIIRQTLFCTADNDNNVLMTGELFDVQGDHLTVIALDGHRIAIRNVTMKNSYPSNKVIVPAKTLNELIKILPGDTDKDVDIFFTDKHIVFNFNDTIVVSRLIEGEYFKIDQMLSSDYETKVQINKQSLLNCINRATLLVKEGDKKPVIMNITDNNLEMMINSTIGSMDENITIEKNGKDLMIGFNPKFLIDALRAIDDEIITIYLVNSKAPCYIKDNDGNYNYMVLPVNFTTVA